jgi:hypothetical protein
MRDCVVDKEWKPPPHQHPHPLRPIRVVDFRSVLPSLSDTTQSLLSVSFPYPPRINPYAVVLTPVTVSDFAVVGVWIYWDVNAAPGIGEKLQYVEAKWDTPTPFTFEGRQFVLFASLKSMEYVMEKTYPKRTPPLAR